jgi:hypothetical protein
MFPDVSEAMWGLTSPTQFKIVRRDVSDYEPEDLVAAARIFDGVLQPLTPQRLAIKPEGMRNWKWWTLWTNIALSNGDFVVDDENRSFMVMSVSDWRKAGFIEYEVTEKVP